MDKHAIESEYARLTEVAKSVWIANPGVGKSIGLPPGYFKLGITLGSPYEFTQGISSFFSYLEKIAKADEALTLVPRNTAHFTFLALAGHYWESINDIHVATSMNFYLRAYAHYFSSLRMKNSVTLNWIRQSLEL